MTLTNPGAISNSSSKPFSNVFGRVAIDNYNILLGSQSLYDFNAKNNKKQSIGIKYPNLQPKTVYQVIQSTQVAN